jgi:hypothetical protein
MMGLSKVMSWQLILNLTVFSYLSCSKPKQRTFEDARSESIKTFNELMDQDQINVSLFNGPILVYEDSCEYIFQWKWQLSNSCQSIEESIIPKNPTKNAELKTIGMRRAALYGTNHFSLNEAALYNLFGLPPDPKKFTIRDINLGRASLNSRQLEDVINFVDIKYALLEYYDCYSHYPDKLSDIKYYTEGNCYIRGLDDSITYDQYGQKYGYMSIGRYIILGTMGKDGKWNYGQAIMDTIINDENDHIFVSDDDIIVKYEP